jgi:hypothetical protein
MNNPEASQHVFIPLNLMAYPQRHGFSCGDCPSACCTAGTVLPLSKDEAWSLIEAGTGLLEHPEDKLHQLSRKERRNDITFYKMETDCGNLQLPEDGGPGKCDVFQSSERPAICREFAVGSAACQHIRTENGVA